MSEESAIPVRPAPEFSRLVNLDELSGQDTFRTIVADAAECASLARRFGIVAVEDFAADVRLRRLKNGDVVFHAHLRARVVQDCVVTLEPVTGEIDEEADIRFRPVAPAALPGKEVDIPADEDFEPFTGSAIDIGEAVAVELALSLEPFPRAPGADDVLAAQQQAEDPTDPDEAAPNPFAVLADRLPKQ